MIQLLATRLINAVALMTIALISASSATAQDPANTAQGSVRTEQLGGTGGLYSLPRVHPHKIVLRGNFEWVAGLYINKSFLGTNQYGTNSRLLVLDDKNHDYINYVYCEWNNGMVNYLELRTFDGHSINAGGLRNNEFGPRNSNKSKNTIYKGSLELKDIYLKRIGGRSGDQLDYLLIDYVPDYRPRFDGDVKSAHAMFLLAVKTGPRTMRTSSTVEGRLLEAREIAFRSAKSLGISATIESDFAAVGVSTTVEATISQEKSGKNLVEEMRALKDATSEVIPVPLEYVAILVGAGDMRSVKNGNDVVYYMMPTSDPEWVIMPEKDVLDAVIGLYDWSDGLARRYVKRMARKYNLEGKVVEQDHWGTIQWNPAGQDKTAGRGK